MISTRRSELEPVASRTMGTPPVGDTSTAGSSSSRAAPRGFDTPVGDGSRTGGVGVKPAQRARGVSPSCAYETREARPAGIPGPRSRPSSLDTMAITRHAQDRSVPKMDIENGSQTPTERRLDGAVHRFGTAAVQNGAWQKIASGTKIAPRPRTNASCEFSNAARTFSSSPARSAA